MRKRKLLLAALAIACALLTVPALAESAETAAPPVDLTDLLGTAITALIALVVHRLLPWLKSVTDARSHELLDAAYSTAVYGAQQLYKTKVIDDRLKHAQSWLNAHGYTADRTRIEAMVRRMDQQGDYGVLSAVEVTTEGEVTMEVDEDE